MKGPTDEAVRFVEQEIISVMRQAGAGAKTADLARKHSLAEATLYPRKLNTVVVKCQSAAIAFIGGRE